MLTKRQNFMETIRGGNPDRFVNQYEAIQLIADPTRGPVVSGPGAPDVRNWWGMTYRWKVGQVAAYPLFDDEHLVLKDVTKWREVVKAPTLDIPEEAWKDAIALAESVDRDDKFVTAFVTPGIFEQMHYLMGMENALINYYEEPEAMHELIDYIADYEIKRAKMIIDHIHPDALFHHDDWGSQKSSFLNPEMFKEFFVPAYKKVYGFYKANGIEVIVHHCDCYAANLVPSMIEMGIDVWQGCMTTNNVPELVKKYGGKISFMGNIDNGIIDRQDWTRELIAREAERACKEGGRHYFIPCAAMGGPNSIFPGVYDTLTAEIERINKEMCL